MSLIIGLIRINSESITVILCTYQNAFLFSFFILVDLDPDFDQGRDGDVEDIPDSRKPSVGPAPDIVYPYWGG